MRFTDGGEGTFGANAGLPTVAIDFLKPVTEKYVDKGVISNADLWTLAANVAIEAMGGPTIPTRYGRVDATDSKGSVESQVGRLPDGDKGGKFNFDSTCVADLTAITYIISIFFNS